MESTVLMDHELETFYGHFQRLASLQREQMENLQKFLDTLATENEVVIQEEEHE